MTPLLALLMFAVSLSFDATALKAVLRRPGLHTALAPALVPLLLLTYTGVELDIPVGALVLDLALTVLVPTVAGVALRTWQPRLARADRPAAVGHRVAEPPRVAARRHRSCR